MCGYGDVTAVGYGDGDACDKDGYAHRHSVHQDPSNLHTNLYTFTVTGRGARDVIINLGAGRGTRATIR